jgi:hypothetical protein
MSEKPKIKDVSDCVGQAKINAHHCRYHIRPSCRTFGSPLGDNYEQFEGRSIAIFRGFVCEVSQ